MKALNLCLHCGANEVSVEQLRKVATPAATETHYPVPHGLFLDTLAEQARASDLEIVNAAQGVLRDGSRAFGLIQVAPADRTDDDGDIKSEIIGWRNSHDKSFAQELALGMGIFVCDNLSFLGQIQLKRKHTRFIERDMPDLVARALGKLMERRVEQDQRIAAYQDFEMSDVQANDLLVRLLKARVLPANKLMHAHNEWANPSYDHGGPTAWRFFNSITETLKGSSMVELPRRTQKLHGLMDLRVGLAV